MCWVSQSCVFQVSLESHNAADPGESRPPGGCLPIKSAGNSTDGNTAVRVIPMPINTTNRSNKACGNWYTVRGRLFCWSLHICVPSWHANIYIQISQGDTCAIVSIARSTALSDFYALNPELNNNCTGLLFGLSDCVKSASAGRSAIMTMPVPPAAASNGPQGSGRKHFQ